MLSQLTQLSSGSMRSDDLPATMVERATIIQNIADDLGILQAISSENDLKIVNYFGITGIGKSFTVTNIFHVFKADYPIVWLDFDITQAARLESLYTWQEVLDTLREIPSLQFAPDTISLSNHEQRSLGSVPVLFRAVNLAAIAEKPLILLLDHLDDLNYWMWLQAAILQPLVGQKKALAICMSQTPLLWHSYSLSDRCVERRVEPFVLQETSTFMRHFDLNLFTQVAQDITYGHPLRLFYLLRLFEQEWRFNTNIEPIPITTLQQTLPPDVFAIISYIGMLRRYDISIVERVLDIFVKDWRQDRIASRRLLDSVSQELRQYFEPYRRGEPYRLVAELRYSIEQLRRTTDLHHYLALCDQLAFLYAERFNANPRRNIDAFLDWAYFSTESLLYGAGDQQHWQDALQTVLVGVRTGGIELAFRLYKDAELAQKLRKLDLFAPLIDIIRESGDPRASSDVLDETELATYRQWVIDRIGQQDPLRRLQNSLNLVNLLATIESLGDDFNAIELYDQLKKIDTSLNPTKLNLAISLLYSSGLVENSVTPRRFTMPKSVRTLVRSPYIR